MKNKIENALFYVQEHISCTDYLIKVEEGFHYREYSGQNEETSQVAIRNYILFLVEGGIEIETEAYGVKHLKEKHMLFIPKGFIIKAKCIKDSKLLIAGFERISNSCDKLNYESLNSLTPEIHFSMNPLIIRDSLQEFVDLMIIYLGNKISCAHLHQMKINEMLMCLRFFYSKYELAEFFFPILGNSMEFRDILLSFVHKVRSVQELIYKTGVGKTVFYEKFSEEFGDISPKKWLNQKLSEKILHLASDPGMSVSKLAKQTGFTTVQQLQQYCKKHIGSTPTIILEQRKPTL